MDHRRQMGIDSLKSVCFAALRVPVQQIYQVDPGLSSRTTLNGLASASARACRGEPCMTIQTQPEIFPIAMMEQISAHLKMNNLATKLKDFDFSSIAPLYENAFPDLDLVDLFRCVITAELVNLSGVESHLIYSALTWTNALEKGDLLLTVPRLGIKGTPPAENTLKFAKAVCWERPTKLCQHKN